MTDETPPEKQPRMDLSRVRDLPPPAPRPQREIKVELPDYKDRPGISAHDRLKAEKQRRPGLVKTSLRTLTGFAIFAVLLVGVFFAAKAIEDDTVPSASWSKPGAPVVMPESLERQ